MIASGAAGLRDRAHRQRRDVGAAVAAVVLTGAAAMLPGCGGRVDVAAEGASATTTTALVVADPAATPPDSAPVTAVEATIAPATAPPPTEPPQPLASCPPSEPFFPRTPGYDLEFDNRLLEVTARLDRTVLARGEGLSIQLEARNTTTEEIEVRTDADYLPNAMIRDTSGALVWVLPSVVILTVITSMHVEAGGIEAEVLPWNSEVCVDPSTGAQSTPARLSPGVYTVETTWLGHVPPPMTFEVR